MSEREAPLVAVICAVPLLGEAVTGALEGPEGLECVAFAPGDEIDRVSTRDQPLGEKRRLVLDAADVTRPAPGQRPVCGVRHDADTRSAHERAR